MAQIDYSYYTGEDKYNDGDVEQKLLEYYKDGTTIDFRRDDVFYLTTHIRENILNWYPFCESDDVLEVGCGCGTLTNLLCQRCHEVVCVEASKRRAEITYERNKCHKNLFVLAGDFGSFDWDKKFNYIVLIGVFEYAKIFIGKENSFSFFLKEIKKFLKPQGKVLIAIENRYGMKYWAGANEDHLYRPYLGLYGYQNEMVQTFGKKELERLLDDNGFVKHKFYYPFPDYKLPEVVFSDERLPNGEEALQLPMYFYGIKSNFKVDQVWPGIIENDMFGFFSNSFLVEAGGAQCILSGVKYAKAVSYRTSKFRIVTVEDERGITKIPVTSNAVAHLDDLYRNHKELEEAQIPACNILKENGSYICKKVKGVPVVEWIRKSLEGKKNRQQIILEKLAKIQDYFRKISEYKFLLNDELKNFYPQKTYVLKCPMLDANVSNLFIDKCDQFILIDQEWKYDGELPDEFLMYFSILYIYKIFKNDLILDLEALLAAFHLSKEKQAAFLKILDNYYFRNKVIDYSVQDRQRALEKYGLKEDSDRIDTKAVCYYDTGNDFNEREKVYADYTAEGNYYVADFELALQPVRIRIDPCLCGEHFIICDEISVNNKKTPLDKANIITVGENDSFIGRNPFYIFNVQEKRIRLKIKMRYMTIPEIEKYLKNEKEYNETIYA